MPDAGTRAMQTVTAKLSRFCRESRRRNFTTQWVFDIFRNMKTRILSTIVMTVVLSVVGLAQAQSPPPSVADIKLLAKGGVSEEVILSQIRNSHAAYRLSTADILDLKDAGVSEKVIDFMINTGGGAPPSPPPAPVQVTQPVVVSTPPPVEAIEGSEPPPPVVEQVVVSPGPGYIWISGFWAWHHHHWEWVRGRWDLPPRRGAIWVVGGWERHGGRVVWVDGYWR
jgi:YXWGXW repeat-containing protein